MGISAVADYAYFVYEDTSRAGCALLLPRIAHFAELGARKGDVTMTARRFPVLIQSPSILVCVSRVETQAEWDAAADCLALRFSPN